MSTRGVQGGESVVEEEMEDHEEMEEDSTSTAGGTFIADTADARLLNLGIPPSTTALFDLRKQ